MKKRVVYIAGPMTGIEDYNFPTFNAAASVWEERGWLVLNPASHLNGNIHASYPQYMRASFHDLLMADAIALLPGWSDSPGTFREIVLAEGLGLDFFDAFTGIAILPPVKGLTFNLVTQTSPNQP